MTGIEERVRGFLENWRLTHCAICQGLLQDGKFIMIDKRLYCLGCHKMKNDAGTRGCDDAKIEKSV